MGGWRRSGRIAKEVPLLIVGTDLVGKVFSEVAKTVTLSRHGAGIVSRHKISPDYPLTLRILNTGKSVDIRLVGPMGHRPDGNVFGVAFEDQDADIWEIGFPPPTYYTDNEKQDGFTLVCNSCQQREHVYQSDVEADVYAVNESILRYCGNCGITTNWFPARPETVPPPPEKPLPPQPIVPSFAQVIPKWVSSFADGENVVSQLDTHPDSVGFVPVYSAQTVVEVLEHEYPPPVPGSVPAAEPAVSRAAAQSQKNRRRDVRARVTFTACIRASALRPEDVVDCLNISRGGFSFTSPHKYEMHSTIGVSLPYSPGNPIMFSPAEICYVEEIPGGPLTRYGAKYLKASGSKD